MHRHESMACRNGHCRITTAAARSERYRFFATTVRSIYTRHGPFCWPVFCHRVSPTVPKAHGRWFRLLAACSVRFFNWPLCRPLPPTAPLSFLRCYHLNARSSLRQHLRPREKADEGSPARSRGLLRSLQSRTQKEELALIETLESGKPISQARDEIDWITDLWQYGEVLP